MIQNKPLEFFCDTITQFQHHVMLLPVLERLLKTDGSLGLITVGFPDLDTIEDNQGEETMNELLKKISLLFLGLKGAQIRDTDHICVSDLGGNTFMIFVSQIRNQKPLSRKEIEVVSYRIRNHLFENVLNLFAPYVQGLPKISMGHSFVTYNPLVRLRRSLHKLIEDAKDQVRLEEPLLKKRYQDLLQNIIGDKKIQTLFHPIIDLQTKNIFGVEALTRGPLGSALESPISLFSIAQEVGMSMELDKVCRQMSLKNSQKLPKAYKVFINVLPKTIQDLDYQGESFKIFLDRVDQLPSNIVFEINERAAINNFQSFNTLMQDYLQKGVHFAIDDLGKGYSSLEAIVKLKPKYLKLDLSLVKGVAQDPVKQDTIQSLVHLSNKTNSFIIAEGIETEEDLKVIEQLGVPFAQGYYFYRPMSVEKINALEKP